MPNPCCKMMDKFLRNCFANMLFMLGNNCFNIMSMKSNVDYYSLFVYFAEKRFKI